MAIPANVGAVSAITDWITRALPVAERQGLPYQPHSNVNCAALMGQWKENAAQHLPEIWRQRLAWDGLSDAEAPSRLLEATVIDEPPDWAPILEELTSFLQECLPAYLNFEPNTEIPFGDLLLPFIDFAAHKIQALAPVHILAPEAWRDIRSSLITDLGYLCDQTLEEEFTRRRPAGAMLLARFSTGDTDPPQSQVLYRAFAEDMLAGCGWLALFDRYPVLARLMAARILYFCEAVAECLLRWEADRDELDQAFSRRLGEGLITEFSCYRSDPHNRGKTVIILGFEGGARLVYKPRDVTSEASWHGLTEALNQLGLQYPLHAAEVLARPGYGWVEYVSAQSCPDREAVRRFYWRAGVLTFLLYAVRGTDMHFENLIAAGEHPVLIDLETLFSSDLQHSQSFGLLSEALWATALRSGVAPGWDVMPNGNLTVDLSALGCPGDWQPCGENPRWKFVGTDSMHRRVEQVRRPPANNVPRLDNSPVRVEEFEDEVIEGFEAAYRLFLEHRAKLMKALTVSFRQCRVRYVLRPTATYTKLLRRLTHPDFLSDGRRYSLELELLARFYLTTPSLSAEAGLFRAEVRAMERLDIPYFTARADSISLTADGEPASERILRLSGFESASRQIEALNAADLQRQVGLLRLSFLTKTARPSDAAGLHNRKLPAPPLVFGESSFQSEAHSLARRLAGNAVWVGEAANWVGLEVNYGANIYLTQPLGVSYFSGLAGVALFLAAAARVTGDHELRRTAQGAVCTIRAYLLDPDLGNDNTRALLRVQGIGGATGIGGTLYGLARVASLLNDGAILEDARRIVTLLDPDLIDEDQTLDVVGGSAGLILV
jgi:type 2 lantibiotic biosynthesis protein LanM